jgi:anti-sigma factor RsiW
MDCTGVAEHLVAYHLGIIEERDRDAVEAHLLECSSCLKTYLAIKRAGDRAEQDRPDPSVKSRLRAEVARTFAPPKPVFFARRIPLYQGVALAAVAAVLALALPSIVHRARMLSPAGTPSIDTSRSHPESSNIY